MREDLSTGRPATDFAVGDGLPSTPLVDAVLEMTHAQGEDVTPKCDADGVTLLRRTPFLRVAGRADGGADVLFFYPATPPDDARLTALPTALPTDATHGLHVDSSALDADLIALEPLIEAAYAQNG